MSQLNYFRELIDGNLPQILEQYSQPAGLYDPIIYTMEQSGKRLRPMLCLAGCAIFDENLIDRCLKPAIGLEIFHNFTLLHDDIMDNSALRRNKPTVHKKWNPNTAILSGDAMMIIANKLIAETPDYALPQTLTMFNQTALEVCEGQQYDIDFETVDNVTEEQYLNMIRLKTSVLLGGSIAIGAFIGKSSPEDAEKLYNFGVQLGIAFQLQDDFLDTFGDEITFGKPIGGDILSNKKTFLLISALNSLKNENREKLVKWLTVKEFDRDEKIDSVKKLYKIAEIEKKVEKIITFYTKNSLKEFDNIHGSKEIIEEIAEFAQKMTHRTR